MKLNIDLPPDLDLPPIDDMAQIVAGNVVPLATVASHAKSRKQQERIETKAKKFQKYFDLMVRALTSKKGVRVPTESVEAAISLRFRCYTARRFFREQGISSVESVIITLDGTSVVFRREQQLVVEDID